MKLPFSDGLRRLSRFFSDGAEKRYGPVYQLLTGDRTASVYGDASAGPITPASALTLAAYYAAINVLSTDLACLPLKVYKRRRSGGRDEVTDDPRSDLLAVSPDGETTSMRWRQAWIGHTLGWGNGYTEIELAGGEVSGLKLLEPTTRSDRRAQDKRLYYRLPDDSTLPPYKVLHLAGLGYDGLGGYSIATMAKQSIRLGLSAESFGAAFFHNEPRRRGVGRETNGCFPPAPLRLEVELDRASRLPSLRSAVGLDPLAPPIGASVVEVQPRAFHRPVVVQAEHAEVVPVAVGAFQPGECLGQRLEALADDRRGEPVDVPPTVRSSWPRAAAVELLAGHRFGDVLGEVPGERPRRVASAARPRALDIDATVGPETSHQVRGEVPITGPVHVPPGTQWVGFGEQGDGNPSCSRNSVRRPALEEAFLIYLQLVPVVDVSRLLRVEGERPQVPAPVRADPAAAVPACPLTRVALDLLGRSWGPSADSAEAEAQLGGQGNEDGFAGLGIEADKPRSQVDRQIC